MSDCKVGGIGPQASLGGTIGGLQEGRFRRLSSSQALWPSWRLLLGGAEGNKGGTWATEGKGQIKMGVHLGVIIRGD